MARNGSGTMAVLNSFTPSTTISSSAVNANFSDIGNEITNSVAADGQTTMTAPLKNADGTAALPSVTFGSDPNTGVYRKAADSLGFATAGLERAYFDSAGKLFALGAADVAGAVNLQSTLAVAGVVSAAGAIEIGHASANTLTGSGGDLSIEGNRLFRAGGADVPIADGGTGASDAASAFTALKQAASDTATGVIEIAIQSEMETGTDVLRAVTPGRQHFHPSACKAWVKWTGSSSTVGDSSGVTSVTDNGGSGDFTINWATAFSSIHYAGFGLAGGDSNALRNYMSQGQTLPTATTFPVRIFNDGGSAVDGTWAGVGAFGDL